MAQQSKAKHAKKRKADVEPREGSAKSQQRAMKQERQSHRKHADSVIRAKSIWNKLRLKTNSKEETRQMTEELMSLIKGKVHEIALQHDASRVVQAALQFGTNEERAQVLQELCSGSLVELAKNQYAHYVVLKSIKYGGQSPECIKIIVKAFKGHIPKLAVHATGSKIIEALFQTFPAKSTAQLRQEFYGPHFALFANEHEQNNDLASHLKKSPGKKDVVLSFLRLKILDKGIDKSLFGYSYYQELFAEYVSVSSAHDIRQLAPTVVDHSIHLLSSKAGTRVVAACASYGTPKDRKRIHKSLKGFAKSALMHRDAYLAILRLVQVTDDTVSTHKNVLNELLSTPTTDDETNNAEEKDDKEEEKEEKDDTPIVSPLLELALDDRACKLFLMLLVPTGDVAWKKLFDPYELTVLEPQTPTVTQGEQEIPTSKKKPDTRREEVLQYLQKPLLELCQNHARELMLSLSGSALIREVYNACRPKDLVKAVVDVCAAELEADKGKEELSLFEDRVGHLAVKNLILCDVEKDDGLLAKEFFNRLQDQLLEVAKSNRGAFILSAVCKVPTVRKEAIQKLRKKIAKIKEMADQSSASAGYEALLKELMRSC